MDEFTADQTLQRNVTVLPINETLSQEVSFSDRVFRTAVFLEEFYTPFISLFGTLGNSLSLAVFSTDSKYKNQSASLYLSALAISDTGFLLTLLAVWLEGVVEGGSILTSSDFSCSSFMYLGQVTCFLSVYLTVAFTIERYVAVNCPLSKARVFTRTNAKRCVTVLSSIALIVCSYAWVIAERIEYPLSPQTKSSSPQDEGDIYNSSEGANGSLPMTLAIMARDSNNIDVDDQTIWDDLGEDARNDSDRNLNHHEGYKLGMHSTQAPLINDRIIPDRSVGISPGYICSVSEAFYKVSEIANYCDAVITFLIPFILIAFFNVQIAKCLWKIKTQRQGIIAMQSRDTCSGSETSLQSVNENKIRTLQNQDRMQCTPSRVKASSDHRQKLMIGSPQQQNKNLDGETKVISGRERKGATSRAALSRQTQSKQQQRCSHYNSPEIHVTKTLLLVSSAFLVLNLPSHLIRCAVFIQNVTGIKNGQEMLGAIQPWANILFNTNFAVNFLLYCMSGKSFRTSLYHLFLRITCGSQHPNHHDHRLGNLIMERWNRSFRSPFRHPLGRDSAATTMTIGMATGSVRENFLRVELGNRSMTMDETVAVNNTGDGVVNYSQDKENSDGGTSIWEHTSRV